MNSLELQDKQRAQLAYTYLLKCKKKYILKSFPANFY